MKIVEISIYDIIDNEGDRIAKADHICFEDKNESIMLTIPNPETGYEIYCSINVQNNTDSIEDQIKKLGDIHNINYEKIEFVETW